MSASRGAGSHDEDAGQGGSDAGCPGKAEGKAHNQGGQRIHAQFFQGDGQTPLPGQNLRDTEEVQLIEAEEENNNATDEHKDVAVITEKRTYTGHNQAQEEKSKADP